MKNLPVRPLRVLGFWVLMFVPLYAANFFLYAFFVASNGSPLVFAALQALTPLTYLGVGYLYYRKDGAVGWMPRLAVIPVWLILTLLTSATLVLPVYGYDWSSILNFQVLQSQGANFAAMLFAAYLVMRKQMKIPKEEAMVPVSDVDALEGPKFE